MAKLRIVSGEQKDTVFDLEGPRITLGRETDNTINLASTQVSRYHAELVLDHYQYKIRDLDSTNGTFINGEKASEAILRDGDQISFGNLQLLYEKRTNKSTIQIQIRPRHNDHPADDPADLAEQNREQKQISSTPTSMSKGAIGESDSFPERKRKKELTHSDSIARIEPHKEVQQQAVAIASDVADQIKVSTTQAPKKVRRTKAGKQSNGSSASSKARGSKKRKSEEEVTKKPQAVAVTSEIQETESRSKSNGHNDSSPETESKQEQKNTIQIKISPLLADGFKKEKNPSVIESAQAIQTSQPTTDKPDNSPPKVLRLTSTVPSVPPPDAGPGVTSPINRQRTKEELRASAAQPVLPKSQRIFPSLRQPDSSKTTPEKRLSMTLNPMERKPLEVQYPKGWASVPGQFSSANRPKPKQLWVLFAIMMALGIPLLITGYRIQSDPAKFFGVVMTMLGLLFGIYAWTTLSKNN